MIKTLRCRIDMPVDFDAKKEYSLLIGLHGANATANEFRTWFEPLVTRDVIVCCPKSTRAAWSPDDIGNVKKLIAAILDVEIEEERAVFSKHGLKKAPAIAVLKSDGTAHATFEGRIEPKALAAALAKVVPAQRPRR